MRHGECHFIVKESVGRPFIAVEPSKEGQTLPAGLCFRLQGSTDYDAAQKLANLMNRSIIDVCFE